MQIMWVRVWWTAAYRTLESSATPVSEDIADCLLDPVIPVCLQLQYHVYYLMPDFNFLISMLGNLLESVQPLHVHKPTNIPEVKLF